MNVTASRLRSAISTASVLLPLRAPPVRNVDGACRASVVDAALGADALPVGVLDLAHLGDGVGEVDQLGRGIAPGDDDVDVARAVADRRDDIVACRSSPTCTGR